MEEAVSEPTLQWRKGDVLWIDLPRRLSADDLQHHLDDVITAAQERKPRVIVRNAFFVDPRMASPSHRRVASAHFRQLFELGLAPELELLVFRHSLMRGVLIAISWAFAPPWTRGVCSTVPEAERQVRIFLRDGAATVTDSP